MMKKIRFIGMNEKGGSLNKENIIFTDDFDSSANEWLPHGMEVYCDKIITMEIPSSFPINHEFTR